MDEDCAFCEIVAGDRTAHELYRTDGAVSFLDAHPAVEGHALVVPTDHCEDILVADDRTRRAVFDAVGAVSDRLRDALDPDGFSTFYTAGPLVGTVTHAHVHVVPRTANDGIELALERKPLPADRGERLAERIRGEG